MRHIVLSSALVLVACSKPAAPPPSTEGSNAALPIAPAADPHAKAQDPNAPLPSGHPPVAGNTPQASAPSAGLSEPARAGGLTWEAPAPLVRRAPKSAMRVAEYGLEGAPEAELTVFYFGADQGGSIDANITRWVGQFAQADGSETKPKRSERKVQGVEVTLVEATGLYSGGMAMPGAPAPAAQSDAMLLGAIAKGPLGSVFFKLVGPRNKLEQARAAFDGLIESIRSESAAK